MVDELTNNGTNNSQYYPPPTTKKEEDFLTPILVLGTAIGLGYILNKHFIAKDNENKLGEGRIYNQDIENYVAAQSIQDLEDTPDFERGVPTYKKFRTNNIVYPDMLYEGMRRQPGTDNVYVNRPIPPSDDTLLSYAEPSNIVTDEILYERGSPDIKEDERIFGVVPYGGRTQGTRGNPLGRRTPGGIDAGASNTIITTEYTPGISEKIRRENPVVISEQKTPSGKKVVKVARLAPLRAAKGRKFNTDYDEKGRLIIKDPVYDTADYLSDLSLTNEDFSEGEPGGRVPADTVSVFEDFLTKGTLKQGYEIIPSED